jgi:hypothetical protein
MSLNNAVFWDVAPCRSCVNRLSSETSIHTRSTWCHIPEDGILRSHRRENLKSYTNGLGKQIWNFADIHKETWQDKKYIEV